MLRTLLIDDEARARENLRILLQRHCTGDVELIGESENVEKGYRDIVTLKPDLVFLDIEMGKGTGFDLLSRFDHYPFKVIFVTAYDHYAIKAIKFSALDYLLKPVSIKDLIDAVSKAKAAGNYNKDAHFQTLFEVIKKPKHNTNRIAIPVQGGYSLVSVDQIIFCQAQKEYTFIHQVNGEIICSSLNLGEYDDLLQDFDFFRVHHSYIINRQYIQRYIRGEGGEIITNNNQHIPVSRRKKDEFLQWLTNK
jgi:two-component system, LytTR family, response regulator